MLLRVPSFYHQFQCIADKCTDSCCVGWEIDVDEKTQGKYRSLYRNGKADDSRQQFLQKLLSNIEDGHFKLLPGDRCPFLKENGLCEMICQLGCNGTDIGADGESILCDICREHPRFVEVYGDIMEKGVGLCCEEAARLLLTFQSTDPSSQTRSGISFIESTIDDTPDEMPEGADAAREAIFAERAQILATLADSSRPLNQRLIEILDFADASNSLIINCGMPTCLDSLDGPTSAQSWLDALNEGESYGPSWDKAYKLMLEHRWQPRQGIFSEEDGARIVAYLIFRYYAKSLFDGDNVTKVQFAIFFWIILQNFGMELSIDTPAEATLLTRKINAVKLLSKQTEYSEEIMDILADHFSQDANFNTESFKRILSGEIEL